LPIPWLVITADKPGAGRGVRGYALIWFLRTAFGRRAVAKRTPDQARRGVVPQAETLFLGLPTSLQPDEILRLVDRVRPSRIVPFDYHDRHKLAWTPEQETALRTVTDRYFKPWFESAWTYNLRMGILPLRTHRQLFLSIAWDRIKRRLGQRREPRYDVGFLGRANTTSVIGADGRIARVDQRVAWLRELREGASDLTLGGGLTEWDNDAFRQRTAAEPDLPDLCYARNNITFPAYWRLVTNCRVLLSPGGNAPWTYRHYESLYAGSAVATIDFRHRDMLVPLPRENMVHVPDGAPIVPAVREALELSHARPNLSEENFEYLERFLHYGSYARSRAALIDRFVAQLT
jgi:hypothetical protein